MRKVLIGTALGAGATLVVLLLALGGWFDTAELKTYDWRMRTIAQLRLRSGPPPVHPDIALVVIDDASIAELAPFVGRWPWPRALHGLLVDYLHRGAPKAIALDIGFWERERESTYPFNGELITSEQSDRALADAARRAGNVILLADATGHVTPEPGKEAAALGRWPGPAYTLGPGVEARPNVTPPYDALAEGSASVGHNFLVIDPDGPARRFLPFVRQGERHTPSLGLAAALLALGAGPDQVALEGGGLRIGDRLVPLVPIEARDADGTGHVQQTILINYLAPPRVNGAYPYPTYAAHDLLRSEGQIQAGETPDVPPASFAGKIVFVGTSAAGLFDVFQTPLGEGVMPGIQLHASVADSVLSNRFLARAPGWSAVLATALAAAAVGVMAAVLPFTAAAFGAAGVAAGWTGLSLFAFSRGTSYAMAQPLLAVAIALFGGVAYRYFVEDREKRKVTRLFGRYVSKDVYDQLLAHPERAELGGARREMSVLFSDIRGFTSVTEKGQPEDLVAQLNEYFSRMVDIVFRHHGTVDKFVGDMVMALFGAPLDDPDHAEHAVRTAVDMVRELGELNRKWIAEGRAALDIGIGVNSGEMIAGNIGSSSIMSYTVIGDNVNLGARLESLNKDYKTRIIISEATRGRLKQAYDIRPLGDVIVKGKSRPVEIFELQVPSPLPEKEAHL